MGAGARRANSRMKTEKFVALVFSAFVIPGIAFTGCVADDDRSGNFDDLKDAPAACVPGTPRQCRGPLKCIGSRMCLENGTEYGPCICNASSGALLRGRASLDDGSDHATSNDGSDSATSNDGSDGATSNDGSDGAMSNDASDGATSNGADSGPIGLGPESVLQYHKNATRDGLYIDAAFAKARVAGLH